MQSQSIVLSQLPFHAPASPGVPPSPPRQPPASIHGDSGLDLFFDRVANLILAGNGSYLGFFFPVLKLGQSHGWDSYLYYSKRPAEEGLLYSSVFLRYYQQVSPSNNRFIF